MDMQQAGSAAPEVLDRREGPFGETVLRRRGGRYEIISNGVFLMDTSDGRSERLLVRAALDAVGTAAPAVLIGGLGVGFSLLEAVADPAVRSVTVVERDPAVVAWHREGPLDAVSGSAAHDPRVRLVEADLLESLRTGGDRYDALCLDVDNGPDWTVTESNAGLYGPGGLALAASRLEPGGVLAVWSAHASRPFEERLREAFASVRVVPVPVAVERAEPDVVYLARR